MLLDAGKAFGRRRRETSSASCLSVRSLSVFPLLLVLLAWICVSGSTSTQINKVNPTTPFTVASSCTPLVVTSYHTNLVATSLSIVNAIARSTMLEDGPSSSTLSRSNAASPQPLFVTSSLFSSATTTSVVASSSPSSVVMTSVGVRLNAGGSHLLAYVLHGSDLFTTPLVRRITIVTTYTRFVTTTTSIRSAIVATSAGYVTVAPSALLAVAPPPLSTSKHGSTQPECGIQRSTCLTVAASHPPTLRPPYGCSIEFCASPITLCEALSSAFGPLTSIAAPGPVILHFECSSSVRQRAHNAIICTQHLYAFETTSSYATSSTSCLPEKLQGLDHILRLGLFAGTSFVKLSIKATTLQKFGFNFDFDLAFCRDFSMTSLLPITRYSVQECGSTNLDCYYVTDALPTHYAVSSIDGSSQNRSYDPFFVAATTVQECGYVSSSHYYVTVASPSQYAVSSIDGSLQSQLYDFSTPSLAAGTYVQECRVASYTRYYVSIAIPAHYSVSNIDGSSQSCPDDPLTGATIFYAGYLTPRSQNPLFGLFNVVLRTRALGLQVKLLYGSLLSLATPIPLYVLVVFAYQFTVEVLSGCIQLCPLGL